MEYQAIHMLSGALALPDREDKCAVAVIELKRTSRGLPLQHDREAGDAVGNSIR
jgi:hypothetical protein